MTNGLNPEMHLVDDLFGEPERKATRSGFGEGMVELGERNESIVALCADLSGSLKLGEFIRRWSDRFYQSGVAEQNMVGMAAGLALSGKIPFATSFGVFMPTRAIDQIRVSVCYNNANVKLAASHTGITVGEDGATHQALEDIAMMRVLPNMRVLVPSDQMETKKATIAAAEVEGPVYIRFGRQAAPVFTTEKTPFEIGKANLLRSGIDVAIIACGRMVYEALLASENLKENGIDAAVLNLHTIKPIDMETLAETAIKCGAVVTAEEHQVMGGMGSAVAEVLVANGAVPIEMVGVYDRFGESGKPDELMEHYGLTNVEIADAAVRAVERK